MSLKYLGHVNDWLKRLAKVVNENIPRQVGKVLDQRHDNDRQESIKINIKFAAALAGFEFATTAITSTTCPSPPRHGANLQTLERVAFIRFELLSIFWPLLRRL